MTLHLSVDLIKLSATKSSFTSNLSCMRLNAKALIYSVLALHYISKKVINFYTVSCKGKQGNFVLCRKTINHGDKYEILSTISVL